MEISSSHQQAEAAEMPIPINSAPYGDHGSTTAHHMIHHHHHDHQPHNHMIKNNPSSSASALVVPQANIPSSNNNNINGGSTNPLLPTTTNTTLQDHDDDDHHHHVGPSKKQLVIIRYRECLKNHAASMGANATDGCGEFMPSGEEGTIEALKCSACNCHRNFHRKEIDGGDHDHHDQYHHHHHQYMMRSRNKFILGSSGGQYHNPTMAARAQLHHQHHMIMSYNNVMGSHHQQLPSSDQSDDQQEDHDHHVGVGGVGILRPTPQGVMKKRIRTKFTQEQKEKMLNFAEKVGWKIQKQEESVVQQFCQEIGVKRRVLKVWMHNNKHNLAKKTIILPSSIIN